MLKDDPKSTSSGVSTAWPRPRSRKLEPLLSTILDQPDKWMNTPTSQLGGRRPAELVGTAEEVKILDILNAIDQGLL